MSDIAIKVDGLGKKFLIGHQVEGDFRGSLAGKVRKLLGSSNGQSREEFWALKDVSFEIKKGEAVGIIGRNGAGKSTMLKILSRITDPTTGRFEINGRVSSLLEVGTGFHSELTGRENIYLNGTILGMRRAEIKKKFDAIVDFSGVEKFIDTPVKHYSSGMKVRLAFSVAAHLEPEILIIDEVLAVGDAEFQKKCLGKMDEVSKNEGRTVLFVSHNMGAVASLCKKGILMVRGEATEYSTIQAAINQYLTQINKPKLEFHGEVIKSVEIKQVERMLKLTAVLATDVKIQFPNFGFVISDIFGNPIAGSNPQMSGINPLIKNGSIKNISVNITSPVLADGQYNLSIWFGDGKENIFKALNCISFEIVNMGTRLNTNDRSIGTVIPDCDWRFY